MDSVAVRRNSFAEEVFSKTLNAANNTETVKKLSQTRKVEGVWGSKRQCIYQMIMSTKPKREYTTDAALVHVRMV